MQKSMRPVPWGFTRRGSTLWFPPPVAFNDAIKNLINLSKRSAMEVVNFSDFSRALAPRDCLDIVYPFKNVTSERCFPRRPQHSKRLG